MRLHFYIMLAAIFMVSCKSKQAAAAKEPIVVNEVKEESHMISEKIIQNQYNNKEDFKTLYIKSAASYKDSKQSQKVTAEIRIRKGEMILVSVRFLGITVAKALITPQEVKYYEKLNSTYFEGNYESLSRWLGTDLDFAKIQNILTGQPISDMHQARFEVKTENNWFQLETTPDTNTLIAYFFDSASLAFKKQQITQSLKRRELQIDYPDFKMYGSAFLPSALIIEAREEMNKTNINIQYQSITLNEDLSFPYSVPEGYEKITIN